MADLTLPRGEVKVLQAEDKDYKRGLLVELLDEGGYKMAYWFNKPDKPYPIEIIVDGKSVSKDGKVVHMKFHPKDYFDKQKNEINELVPNMAVVNPQAYNKLLKRQLTKTKKVGTALKNKKDPLHKRAVQLVKRILKKEMLNYPNYLRNQAPVPQNNPDGEHRYYLPKKYRKKNEAIVIKEFNCGCHDIYKVERIEEKWSQKYKKSINCSNPKGFSQKAHCQGRKKK